MRDVSEKIVAIIDKQNELMKKLGAGAIGEHIIDITNEITEKLRHTMFMV